MRRAPANRQAPAARSWETRESRPVKQPGGSSTREHASGCHPDAARSVLSVQVDDVPFDVQGKSRGIPTADESGSGPSPHHENGQCMTLYLDGNKGIHAMVRRDLLS